MKLGISVLVGVGLAIFLSVFSRTPGGEVSAQVATDPIFVGAGDIARCAGTGDEATAELLNDISGTVFTTGDNAYQAGSTTEFGHCYDNLKADGTTYNGSRTDHWGEHKARTKPTPGNHEYVGGTTPQYGAGYFSYFGAAAHQENAGSYSYDLGAWHLISLNTGQCYGTLESDGSYPRCGPGDPMITWLHNDLASHTNQCTLAYFHHPRFTSGKTHGNDFARTTAIWNELYNANADLVLNGHSHNYERFAPQTPNGMADPERGIRQFVVGTGGGAYHGFGTIKPNSEVRNSGEGFFGVLKLTLHPSSYDWEFRPVAGTFTDSGSGQCHGAPANPDDTVPLVQPPQQELPTGGTLGTTTVPTKLTWSGTDDQGSIASYELQSSKDGGSFTGVSLPSATSTTKTLQLSPGSTYQFRVKATDSAGNTSEWATGQAFLVDAQQENSAAIVYTGGWTQQSLTSAYGGGVKYATAKGSAAQFTCNGCHTVAWVSTKGPNMGKATVSVDGVIVKTADLYNSTTQSRRIMFSKVGLDPSVSHVFEIRVLGTKNTASSDTRVDFDGFVVLR